MRSRAHLLYLILGLWCAACQPPIAVPAPTLPEIAPVLAPPSVETDALLPIFDTHLHYNREAWTVFAPSDMIDKLKKAGVRRALVSSTPDDGTRMLYQEDPARIVPFLRPYRGNVTASNWFIDEGTLLYLTERLQTPIYAGIGEFHLYYEAEANAPIVQETVRMAVENDFFLHVHSDAASVRAIFAYEPNVKILWAHAGLTEPVAVVGQMLDEYPSLWADIAIREYAIAPDGVLDPTWRDLFLRHPDRMTIGSDTWVTPRWRTYEELMAFHRGWLAQLPREVAEQIAWRNAAQLFGGGELLPE